MFLLVILVEEEWLLAGKTFLLRGGIFISLLQIHSWSDPFQSEGSHWLCWFI